MTMVGERTSSLIETGKFLRELARNESLPEAVRLQARSLSRHYPDAAAIRLEGRAELARRGALSQLAEDHQTPSLPLVLGVWLASEPFLCDETLTGIC